MVKKRIQAGIVALTVVLTVVLAGFFSGMAFTAVQEAKQPVSDGLVYEFDDGSRVTVIHATPGSILLGFGGPSKDEGNADNKMDIVVQEIRRLLDSR